MKSGTDVAPPRYQFFIFAWPGHAERALALETDLCNLGEEVQVIASGIPDGPGHWIHLPNEAYFGAQFAQCLRMADGDFLVHIQADATLTNLSRFVERLKAGFEKDSIAIWAPDVDYSFYSTRMVRAPEGLWSSKCSTLPRHLVPVINTDCTCWAMRQDVVRQLREFMDDRWNLGWGWDSLASAISWTQGLLVVRDIDYRVEHPRGTGYDSYRAESEFEEVKRRLPLSIGTHIALSEALVHARYTGSSQWLNDRLRSRMPSVVQRLMDARR